MSRTVFHASGFVDDGRASSVKITSYEGDLEDVVPGIVATIRSQGHDVKVSRTKPLGDWWLVAVDLLVTVKGSEGNPMWHHFAYPDSPWAGAGPAPTTETEEQNNG